MNRMAVFHRLRWRAILLGLSCALASWAVTRHALARGLENWALDGAFQWRGTRPTSANVVIIGLDERSLDELRKPRRDISPELAEIVRLLHREGAAAIGIDLLIPASLTGEPEFRKGGRGDASALGEAVTKAGNVVLPRLWLAGQWMEPVWQWRQKHLLNPEPTDFGFVNVTEDGDHFARCQKLVLSDDDGPSMHFALALFARASGAEVEWQDGRLRLAGEPVPLDASQRLRVNFAGPPGSFPVVSFRDALAAARGGPPLARSLRGAAVIIGSTAGSQQDFHATPFANNYFRRSPAEIDGLMAGPELHANVFATLADGAYMVTMPWLSPLLLAVFGPLLGLLFGRLNLEVGAAVALAHHFAWKFCCLQAFNLAGWQVEVLPMLLLGGLTYGATFALRWRRLRGMMGVVQSEAVAKLLEASGRLDPCGQEQTITVLFADIRSFTDFSERHTPREVVALLNAYFGAVAPLIEAHGGTLNKYLGDGLLAFFGAPEPQEDHALHGARAAAAMVGRVHYLKETWARLGYAGMRIGVGVHTGRVVVGTVGSRKRLEYTAIGDTVNTAARIESENKSLGTEILLSAATLKAIAAGERESLGLDPEPKRVKVKGKEEPLELFALSIGDDSVARQGVVRAA
jgi:adenylate cyclase